MYSIKTLLYSWNKKYNGYWGVVRQLELLIANWGPFIYQEVTRADIDDVTESTSSILKCFELESLYSICIINCIYLKTFKDP